MTNVNKGIQNHRSVRNFLNKSIPNDIINTVLLSAQAMPTSNNNQDISIIVVKDKVKKAMLSDLSGYQRHVADAPVFFVFIADLYKAYQACLTQGQAIDFKNPMDKIITATFDAGIAMGACIIAAESLGLGITPIGGIRNNLEEVVRILELPEYTFPLVGLCMGYPYDIPDKKPRMAFQTFMHEEVYDKEGVPTYIGEYDEIMENYLQKIKREQEINWTYSMAKAFSKESNNSLEELLRKQKITKI